MALKETPRKVARPVRTKIGSPAESESLDLGLRDALETVDLFDVRERTMRSNSLLGKTKRPAHIRWPSEHLDNEMV